MKVIIAGSRSIDSFPEVFRAIVDSKFDIEEVVCGGAQGVDAIGATYASWHDIPVKVFKPDWSKGRKAGPIRNREMAKYADALIAVWDGQSRGTDNMIDEMVKQKKPVYIHRAPIA